MSQKTDLTIIILSYNVEKLLLDCLASIYKNQKKSDNWQVIVVDNASTDNSVISVKHSFKQVEIIQSSTNLGFSSGNNLAVKKIKADITLFLNPDTLIVGDVIQSCLIKLKSDPTLGAISPRVELPSGRLDYSCHRGFPTPWNSLAYFTGLSKLSPKSALFAGYSATYLDIKKPHLIDCINGAFLMVKTEIGQKINWWDEDYFWNGEDIEFCYRIKQLGYNILFYPPVKIIHFKGSSSGLQSTAKATASKQTKINSAKSGARAMRIFFIKHYYQKYPPIFRELILLGIYLLEKYRIFKIYTGLKYG